MNEFYNILNFLFLIFSATTLIAALTIMFLSGPKTIKRFLNNLKIIETILYSTREQISKINDDNRKNLNDFNSYCDSIYLKMEIIQKQQEKFIIETDKKDNTKTYSDDETIQNIDNTLILDDLSLDEYNKNKLTGEQLEREINNIPFIENPYNETNQKINQYDLFQDDNNNIMNHPNLIGSKNINKSISGEN